MICSPAFPNTEGTLGVELYDSSELKCTGAGLRLNCDWSCPLWVQPASLRSEGRFVCTITTDILDIQAPTTIYRSKHRFLIHNGD